MQCEADLDVPGLASIQRDLFETDRSNDRNASPSWELPKVREAVGLVGQVGQSWRFFIGV
jgi:hypothetical protein